MSTCAFSPTGDILAVAGRRGHIHLVDWNSGAGQVVASLKMNAGVKSLWWSKGNGGGERQELLTLGENSEVYVWDVGQRRCVRRWRDDGEFGSAVMTGDPAGKYLAIGYVSLTFIHHTVRGILNAVCCHVSVLGPAMSMSMIKTSKVDQNLTSLVS